jgi:hypothetical protein
LIIEISKKKGKFANKKRRFANKPFLKFAIFANKKVIGHLLELRFLLVTEYK